MCFNPSPVRRVPSPNRYMAVARFCFCKNNKRTIIICGVGWTVWGQIFCQLSETEREEEDSRQTTQASLLSPGDAVEARNLPGLPAHGGGWARGAAARCRPCARTHMAAACSRGGGCRPFAPVRTQQCDGGAGQKEVSCAGQRAPARAAQVVRGGVTRMGLERERESVLFIGTQFSTTLSCIRRPRQRLSPPPGRPAVCCMRTSARLDKDDRH